MAGYLVLRKFTGRHWLALVPSKLQSSRNIEVQIKHGEFRIENYAFKK